MFWGFFWIVRFRKGVFGSRVVVFFLLSSVRREFRRSILILRVGGRWG